MLTGATYTLRAMAATRDRAESAIVVPVDLPVAMRRLRDGLDPSAAVGVPPHITLLYPFADPARLDESLRAAVSHIIASEPVFAFVLSRVGRWPQQVYLPPDPSEPFTRLIERLAGAYPDYPPYSGAHAVSDIVPHLTIADSERGDYLDAAAHALPPMLPVRAVAREATLIAHGVGEPWGTVWRLPLSSNLRPAAG